MDRIDLHIDVKRVPPAEVLSRSGGTSSAKLREEVMAGREFASWRKETHATEPTTQGLIEACRLSSDDAAFFEHVSVANNMSGRGIVRVLSVARTIADMAQRPVVERADLCEALAFRVRDGIGR